MGAPKKDLVEQFATDPFKANDLAFLYELAHEYPESELVQAAIVMAQKAATAGCESS
jgi:hypothetical protein